jgi:hypothetical protein
MKYFIDEFQKIFGFSFMYVLTEGILIYTTISLKNKIPRWKELTDFEKRNAYLAIYGSLLFIFILIIMWLKPG